MVYGDRNMDATLTLAFLLCCAPSLCSLVSFSDGVQLVVEDSSSDTNGTVHLQNVSHNPQIQLLSWDSSLLCVVQFLSSPPGGVLWWVNQTRVFPSDSWTSWTGLEAGLYSAACLWKDALQTHGASVWCGVELHGQVHKQTLCSD